MKCALILLLTSVVYVLSAPADKPSSPAPKQGSPFISSFDEIVVESSLMVRGRNSQSRQGRTKLVAVTTTPSSNTTSTSTTTTPA
uniref:Putative secreted protein n=1 Tax=Panstrongylus lignarius TaxID=156445 RepID=A0A224XW31_9HEMI